MTTVFARRYAASALVVSFTALWGCTTLAGCGAQNNNTPGPVPATPTTTSSHDTDGVVVASNLPPAPTTTPTSAAPTPVAERPRAPRDVEPLLIERPPFQGKVVSPIEVPKAVAPALRQLSTKPNNITDDEEWFKRHQLPQRSFNARSKNMPVGVQTRLGRLTLRQGINHPDHRVLVFGDQERGGFVIALQRPDGHTLAVYDFSQYLRSPKTVAGDERFVAQSIHWAEARDGVLYVANGHRTYAKSSFGQNAYLTAIDQKTGALRWRSQPLVAGARTFVLTDAHIVTGYGFTDERDFLVLLNRTDGTTARRIPLTTGPDDIIEKDGKLFVRCYNTDYQFSL